MPDESPTNIQDRAHVRSVLMVSTGNAVRSIFAEALLNMLGRGRFRGYAAGTNPERTPHQPALAHLAASGYTRPSVPPASWEVFARPDAAQMDFVITLSRSAAVAAQPQWPGTPTTVHWPIPPVAERFASEQALRSALANTYAQLTDRIILFVATPFDTLDPAALHARLAAIGRIDDDPLSARPHAGSVAHIKGV